MCKADSSLIWWIVVYAVRWRNGYKVDRFESSRMWSVHEDVCVFFAVLRLTKLAELYVYASRWHIRITYQDRIERYTCLQRQNTP